MSRSFVTNDRLAQTHNRAFRGIEWIRRALSSDLYPDWVRTGQLSPREIPVFYYHDVSTTRFERDLLYLRRNGYETVIADEYLAGMTSGTSDRDRLVMLTFDDGLASLFRVIFPLLKSFHMRAVAFVLPGQIGQESMATWNQIREMSQSGVIDIQSHGMTHRGIYVNSRVEDFWPSTLYSDSRYLYPLQLPDRNLPDFFPGMPIYRTQSRMTDHRRFHPAGEVETLCREFVERGGGNDFFKRKNWKAMLLRELNRRGLRHYSSGRYETLDEQYAAMLAEVADARRAIEGSLDGKIVRHYAYPWHQSGQLASRALAEAGYATAAGGLSDELRGGSAHGVYHVRRVSLDFLRCLPGTGRLGLERAIARKVLRNLTGPRPATDW